MLNTGTNILRLLSSDKMNGNWIPNKFFEHGRSKFIIVLFDCYGEVWLIDSYFFSVITIM